MKKLTIFAVAAAFIFAACDSTAPTQSSETQSSECQSTASEKIGYVYGERVISQSEIFLTEGVALRTKSEKAQAAWAKKEQGFQYEASQLQEKYQKGLITLANAQKQQESIESRVRTYQTTAQKEAQTLEEENFVFSNRVQDLFIRAVKQLNDNKDYKMILDASVVIDADSTLDLSDKVLAIVNELYASEQKADNK